MTSENCILKLELESEDENRADFSFAVSLDGIPTFDGMMMAESVELVPQKSEHDILFGGIALSAVSNIMELSRLLFMAAEITNGIIEYYDENGNAKQFDFWGRKVSVWDIAKKTISQFVQCCEKKGITTENLRYIILQNRRIGWGDCAMWLEAEDLLECFEEYLKQSAESQDVDKLNALINYVKSNPVLPTNDYNDFLPEKIPCVWEGTDKKLKNTMKKLLNGKMHGNYWIGTYCEQYIVDVKEKTIQQENILYYGNDEYC